MIKKMFALAICATIAAIAAPAGATDEFVVNKRFAHIDRPEFVTQAMVNVNLNASDVITVRHSDGYNGRSGAVGQVNERTNVYGVSNGSQTLLGTTDDLADGIENASATKSFLSTGTFDSLLFVLHPDNSTPNSHWVDGFSVTRFVPEPTPTPEVTIPEVTVPEVTVPEVTIPEVTIPEVTVPEVTVPEVTVPEVTVPEVTVPEVTIEAPSIEAPEEVAISVVDEDVPMTTLPRTGTEETIALGVFGLVLMLGGYGLVNAAKR